MSNALCIICGPDTECFSHECLCYIPMAVMMAFTACTLIALSTILTWQITYQATTSSVLTLAQIASRGAISQFEESYTGYLQLAFESRIYILNWFGRFPAATWSMDDLDLSMPFFISLISNSIHGITVATHQDFYLSVGFGGYRLWVSNGSGLMYELELNKYGEVTELIDTYPYLPTNQSWFIKASTVRSGGLLLLPPEAKDSGVITINMVFPVVKENEYNTSKKMIAAGKIWLYLGQTRDWLLKSIAVAKKIFGVTSDRSHFIYILSREGIRNKQIVYGPLIAASHGSIYFDKGEDLDIRLAHESDEPVISSSARMLLDKYGSYQKIDETPLLSMSISEGNYFVLACSIRNDSIGLDIIAVEITNKELILGKIEANNRIVILIVSAILLGSIFTMTILTHFMTRSLNTLAVLMSTRIVNMDVEDVPKLKSYIREVRVMQNSFSLMCEALQQYRAYLPEAIFVVGPEITSLKFNESETSPLIKETAAVESVVSDIPSSPNKVLSPHTTSPRRRGSNTAKLSPHNIPPSLSYNNRRGSSLLALNLQKKSATLMMVALPHLAMCNFSEFPQLADASKSTEEMLSHIHQEIKDEKSAIITTFGIGWALVTWKCSSALGDVMACKVALRLVSSIQSENRYVVGISSAVCLTGNVGTNCQRTNAIMGEAPSKSRFLCSLCSAWGAKVLASESVYQNAFHQVELRQIDKVQWISSPYPEPIYQVMCERSFETGEWMYELETAEQMSQYKTFNEGFAAFLDNDYDTAKEKLLASLVQIPNDGIAHQLIVQCDLLKDGKHGKYLRRQLPMFDYVDPNWTPLKFILPFSN